MNVALMMRMPMMSAGLDRSGVLSQIEESLPQMNVAEIPMTRMSAGVDPPARLNRLPGDQEREDGVEWKDRSLETWHCWKLHSLSPRRVIAIACHPGSRH